MIDNSIPDFTLGALTAKQTMARLNLSKSGLYKLCRTRKLVPLAAFSRNRLFSIASIVAFLNDKKK